ncbi:hypothetical protein J3Q64DRAFT_1863977 [Phycomyces blakesleeanus]|uniref:F-box domain-containing protein n=2 Tax=Phycomyces blakesleeanus TaxID=4837 RepID=A0A162UVR2_PHYB8|nr:hypothetical protein PHYBLDRAFT_163430 [Phycomyces blakesleeanus NRRL 1555(-)]OAD78313.1 hypothetical protein PHYBLDRAFT_163430 [Phycomyces blakesleeanus NRRL 1555(-)]|eukprot:XP_018296353.1 hypothetical protein PHYBLDRAFT_163430 [Phycomyces blakesleeanus NRRL 1555(-)]
MGVSELPFELLVQISDNLSTKDILSCALTCKAWRNPFQKALWREIRLYNFHSTQRFIDIIKDFQDVSISYPHLVHSLCIDGRFRMPPNSDSQVSDLSMYLPNIKSLCVENISRTDICTELTRSHKIWKSLESLKVDYERSENEVSAKNLFEFINTCTMLQKLEIRDDGLGFNIERSVDYFENMHRHLQNLSFIKVGLYLTPDILDTLDTIPNTIPAFSVIYLDINSKRYKGIDSYDDTEYGTNDWDPLWLYYFGYKYPNLRSLKLDFTNIFSEPINPGYRQMTISLFHSNPNAFRHLETFDLTTDYYFEFSDFILWELFCSLRIPLKYLTLDATNYGAVDDSNPMDIDRILQSFSETLESLSVTGFIYSERNQDSTIKLSSCYPLLTNLCIRGREMSLNLEDLLDKCVALKQLEYCGGILLINPNTTTEESNQHQKQHGLQILKLHDFSAAAEVFDHISFKCRSLEYMDLSVFYITGNICERNGCLLLDMSHTFLKTLNIAQIRYGSTCKKTHSDDAIGLTLLSQLYDDPSAGKESEREENHIDSKNTIVKYCDMGCFYTYDYHRIGANRGLHTMQLSKTSANIALGYYQNSWPNKFISTLKDDNSYDGVHREIEWERELCKGYAKWSFGKVKDIHFISI